MAMTITEKILAKHAGKAQVQPGENIWVNVDMLMTHDVCGPGTIGIFEKEFGKDADVFDPDRIVIIPDHYIFTADPLAHRNIEILRDFVKRKGIRHYYDPDFIPPGLEGMPTPYKDPKATSYKGVCHAALPECGHTRPGEVLLGTDSHSCTAGAFGQFATGVGNTDAAFVMGTGKIWLRVPPTLKFVFKGHLPGYLMAKDLILHVIGEIGVDGGTYKALEFSGEALAELNIDERMTFANMAIEAGGKNGIIPADDVTEQYVRARTDIPFEMVASDDDATYQTYMEFDTGQIEPTVARPHSPDNRALARDLKDVKLDRAYIGSCTGGKTTDFVAAARILCDQKVAVDTFVVPATTAIHAALGEITYQGKTLEQIFLDAGCLIGPASCAACLGGPKDTLGRANEAINVISTTNRNFPGRMGHKQAGVHLASPLTVAASAITGHVTDPREYFDAEQTIGLIAAK